MHRQRSLLSNMGRRPREMPIGFACDAIEKPRRLPHRPGRSPSVHPSCPSISPRSRRPASIPIEPAAPPRPTSRDFVPWRFSDAGLQCAWPVRHGRRPRNLHTSGLRHPLGCCAAQYCNYTIADVGRLAAFDLWYGNGLGRCQGHRDRWARQSRSSPTATFRSVMSIFSISRLPPGCQGKPSGGLALMAITTVGQRITDRPVPSSSNNWSMKDTVITQNRGRHMPDEDRKSTWVRST